VRIFIPKRDEMTGGWRKLHNEELHNLYSSPSIIRMMKSRRTRWAGHVARMGRRAVHIGYYGNARGKRPLGRPRRRWVNNIKMDLREMWIGLVWLGIGDQWRVLVNTVMNLWAPWNAVKFLSSCSIGGFPRRAQLHE
jgi:hypothetical protein